MTGDRRPSAPEGGSSRDRQHHRREAAARGMALVALPLALVVAPMAASSTAVAPSPVVAEPGPRAASPSPVAAWLSDLSPVTVRPDRRLTVEGAFSTSRGFRGVEVQLAVGTERYSSQVEVTEAATLARAATVGPLDDVVTVPVPEATRAVGRVRPGRTSFRLVVPPDTLPLTETGVYPVEVRVVATGPDGDRLLAAVRSFLPLVGTDAPADPAPLLWLWPLVDQPHRDHRGWFVDTDLPGQLRPGGRLARLVEAASDHRVTWVVDPGLLSDAEALTGRWRLTQDGRSTSSLPADPAAAPWLSDLREATRSSTVVGLPYADPDLVSVAQAGRPGVARNARALGTGILREQLGGELRADLAWPGDGYADSATLAAAVAGGGRVGLLSGLAVPLVEAPFWTPSGRVDLVDGRLPTLLSDPTLDAIVADPGSGPGDVLLSRQELLAQTLVMVGELPSEPRLAVVAPPRAWDPSAAWAEAVLDATSAASWLRLSSFEAAVARPAPAVERLDPQLPDSVAATAVPTEVVTTVSDATPELRTFTAILTDRQPSLDLRSGLLSATSTAWRGDPVTAEQRASDAAAALKADRSQVRIVTGDVTLSAQTAPLPLTVRNGLGQDVRVRLGLVTDQPLRLRLSAPDEVIVVPAGGNTSVSVEVTAVTGGTHVVRAGLLTPAGARYDVAEVIEVDVRAYGQVALIVFGLATTLLVLAALVRLARRIRGGRRPEPTP